MNSPSCTIPSEARPRSPRAGAAAVLAAVLLCACGGSKPDPERPARPGQAEASPDPAKGQGVVTFRYSNRSTDANLQVDLGATDISLEMTGRPAEAARESAEAAKESAAPRTETKSPPKAPPASAQPAEMEPEAQEERKAARKPKAAAKPRPDTEPAEEESDASGEPLPQDVTDKVLLGIRKAQEFFYQKRYPEALQMVRSSLDARPTAEGHALAGSIHYMMGATGLARRHWQQALRLNPDMPAVVNMLEKIATPGGRGSPHPRPLAVRRNTAAPSPSVLEAAAPLGEPPFPDEMAEPVAPPGSVPATPAAAPAPAPRAGEAPAAPSATPPASSSAPAAPSDEVAAAPAASDASAAAAGPAAPAAQPAAAARPAPAKPEAPAQSVPGPAIQRTTTGSGPGGKPKFPQKAPAKPAEAAKKDKTP